MRKATLFLYFSLAFGMLSNPSLAQDIFDFQQKNGELAMRCYVPPDLEQIRGILFCGNGAGGDARSQVADLHKRTWAHKHGFAIIATGKFGRFKDGVEGEDYAAFQSGLKTIAMESGHEELLRAPWLLWGFSNGGQMAYGLSRLHPERTIAFIVNKGGYYISDEDGGVEPTAVPAIFFGGEADKGKNLRCKVIHERYRNGRAQGAPWCWIEERNAKHEVGNSEPLAFAFFEAILSFRYPDSMDMPPKGYPILTPVAMGDGWLVEEGHAAWRKGWGEVVPYDKIPQENRTGFGWLPSESLARLYRTCAYYDPSVKHEFSRWQKAVNIMLPYDPAEPIGKKQASIPRDKLVELRLEVSPHITDWHEVILYMNGDEIANQSNEGSNTLSFTLNIEDAPTLAAIHAELNTGDSSGTRGSHVLLLVPVAGKK